VWSEATFLTSSFRGEARGGAEPCASGAERIDQEKCTLAVWSEATFLTSSFRGEAPRAAEPRASGAERIDQEKCTLAVWSEATERNEKAVRQPDGLLFQGRIVPTVIRKAIRTFWQKS